MQLESNDRILERVWVTDEGITRRRLFLVRGKRALKLSSAKWCDIQDLNGCHGVWIDYKSPDPPPILPPL